MLTLQAIRIFVEVSQRNSFSAAGRALGLSPGAVSRQIAALESDLQVQLVNRSSRKLSLTESGKAICQGLQAVVEEVRSVEELALELQKVPHGILRVHSRVTFGLACVVPLLPRFVAQYPDIRLDLRLSDEDVNLLEDNVEVDIRVGRLSDSTDMVRKIAPSHTILCASPAYLRLYGPPTSPGDLMNHNCLVYQRPEGPLFWRFSKDGEKEKIPVTGSIQSNSSQAIRLLAVQGLGVALLSEWAIVEDIATGRLQQILPEYEVSTTAVGPDIYLVYRQKRHLPLKIRAFIDFLSDNLPRSRPLRDAVAFPAAGTPLPDDETAA